MDKPVFSIIAPIYNELENLPLLYARLREVMDQSGELWELILVDDGSADGSTEVIRKLGAQDARVRPVISRAILGTKSRSRRGWITAAGTRLLSLTRTFRTRRKSSWR